MEKEQEDALILDKCLLLGRPCCPFPALNTFWKVTIGATAILMLVLFLTLLLMSSSMNRFAADLTQISVKIDSHKQLTLENRGVTSEIKGMLTGWIEERRREVLKEHPDWKKK